MPSDWLSWEFWAKDIQSLHHLALIVSRGDSVFRLSPFGRSRPTGPFLSGTKRSIMAPSSTGLGGTPHGTFWFFIQEMCEVSPKL
jgi:hypothetical protein